MAKKTKGVRFEKKDKFADLEDDFKQEVAMMKTPKINERIAEWAKEAEAQKSAMKEDEDLKMKKEVVKEASAGYREAIKGAQLRIAFAMRVLEDRGA